MKSDTNIYPQLEETITAETVPAQGALALEEALQMLHELQAHQVELEKQNNDLLRQNAELENRLQQSYDLSLPFASHIAEMNFQRQLESACQTCEKANAVLSALLESMSDWFWEIDSDGRYAYCSPQVETFLGFSPDEMVGKAPFDFMPPEEAERVGIQLKEIFQKKSHIQNMENWNICKDGRRILLVTNGVPILDSDGNLKGYRGVDRNITEQRRIEEELRSLSRAVQQSPVTIVITDIKGLIEFVNPKFTELTGYTAEEAIGQNPRILNAGQTPHEVFVDLWKTIASGNTWKGEVLNKAKDGSLFWEISTVSPLFDDKGVITHYLAVKEDITEKKRISDELSIAKEQAEAASLAKSSFLATMSHEIRTPMNGVIGMTSLLLDTEMSTEQREYTEIVRMSAENLLTIINEILDFSKIEAGKLNLEILDFDLRPTIEDTAELLAFRVADKGLELICSIDPDVPSYLKGDPGRLRQVIINLVGNAIKFTQHGEIVISTSLSSDQDGVATIRFEISDTGIGIPSEKLDAIFSPFSQADSSTSRNFGGTGLGLPICKQLAELMGGEIGVTSETGKGSTFWFTARFEKQPLQTAAVTKDAAAALHADISGIKILAATNSVTNRSLLLTLLNQWGCVCETAADGEGALKLLQQASQRNEPFRIILMDQKMPGMGGSELGRRIKSDPQLASTLMVMLTAAGQRGDAAALKDIGFDGYLIKPVRPNQLHDCIALVLGRSVDPHQSESSRIPPGIITRHTVAEYSEQRVRILLAEDNIINQKVAQGMLNKLGYKTDVAANGREAVRALGLIDYDLVFMDCMMPEMDGFEATAAIRDAATPVRNHNVPIIAMTANAMSSDREACLAAGMNDYLAKPVRRDELASALEKWLLPGGTMDMEAVAENQVDDQAEPQLLLFDATELLSNFDDDREFAESILNDALQELPEDLKTLCELAVGDDSLAVRHHAHTVKGLAANICTPALRDICFKIETAAHDGDMESVRKLIPDLERVVLITTEAVRANTF